MKSQTESFHVQPNSVAEAAKAFGELAKIRTAETLASSATLNSVAEARRPRPSPWRVIMLNNRQRFVLLSIVTAVIGLGSTLTVIFGFIFVSTGGFRAFAAYDFFGELIMMLAFGSVVIILVGTAVTGFLIGLLWYSYAKTSGTQPPTKEPRPK